ncbi:MAG TPA: hypothetical protein VGD17_07530 [Chitinophagaceae bacterium]
MLSDSEKAKIQSEESYRREVNRLLDGKSSKRTGIIKFLNSALGIWFLSTIIIGLFTYFYNRWDDNRKINYEREVKIRQLDLEIESRISQFWVNYEPLFVKSEETNKPIYYTFKFHYKKDTLLAVWNTFRNAPSLNPRTVNTMFIEYDTRNTVSLLIELADLLSYNINRSNRKRLTNEIKEIQRVAAFIAANGPMFKPGNPELLEVDPKETWKLFKEKIIIQRWDKMFPYTDCLFC